jgi:hypothetical protein
MHLSTYTILRMELGLLLRRSLQKDDITTALEIIQRLKELSRVYGYKAYNEIISQ